jgi:hypothetical protein
MRKGATTKRCQTSTVRTFEDMMGDGLLELNLNHLSICKRRNSKLNNAR